MFVPEAEGLLNSKPVPEKVTVTAVRSKLPHSVEALDPRRIQPTALVLRLSPEGVYAPEQGFPSRWDRGLQRSKIKCVKGLLLAGLLYSADAV